MIEKEKSRIASEESTSVFDYLYPKIIHTLDDFPSDGDLFLSDSVWYPIILSERKVFPFVPNVCVSIPVNESYYLMYLNKNFHGSFSVCSFNVELYYSLPKKSRTYFYEKALSRGYIVEEILSNCSSKDVSQLQSLHRVFFDKPSTTEELILRPNSKVFVARDVMGNIVSTVTANTKIIEGITLGEITWAVTDPQHERQGLYGALTQMAIDSLSSVDVIIRELNASSEAVLRTAFSQGAIYAGFLKDADIMYSLHDQKTKRIDVVVAYHSKSSIL